MRPIFRTATAVGFPLALLGCATGGPQPAGLGFDVSRLSGWWAESYSTRPACDPSNLRINYRFAADGKRVEIAFDRPWLTATGMAEKLGADIVSSTPRTLTIRYDRDPRRTQDGRTVEWELSVVAPGVYRWRQTDWDPRDVNDVVGIRCAE